MKRFETIILAVSPLSKNYLGDVRKSFNLGESYEVFDLPSLRKMSVRTMISKLRSIRCDTLYVCSEDPSSVVLVKILATLSVFIRSKKAIIVDHVVSESALQKWKIPGTLMRLLINTFYAQLDSKRFKKEAAQLLKLERLKVGYDGNLGLYLKTNLWFGIKAGGSIGHVSGVINAMIEKGYQLDYCSMEEPVGFSTKVNHFQIPIFKKFGLPSEINLFAFQKHFMSHFWSMKGEKDYDFIYSRMAITNFTNIVLSRKLKIPLILEYNGSEVWVSENWGSGLRYPQHGRLAEEVCLKHAHLIVVVSQVLKDELIQRGIEAERILFYPNCIDEKKFDPGKYSESQKQELRKEYGVAEDEQLATFIGTFGQWHGAEVFAEAIRILCEESDYLDTHKLKFLMVGDGQKMAEVRSILASDQCKEQVIFTGLIPQHEAPLHLAASDILVSPHVPNVDGTKFFGSPTKLFEYMAMDKPIIASDLDQIGDVLRNSYKVKDLQKVQDTDTDKLSVLTEPGSADEIVKALMFLAENKNLATQLGKNARKESLTKYTWKIHVQEIMNQFDLMVK